MSHIIWVTCNKLTTITNKKLLISWQVFWNLWRNMAVVEGRMSSTSAWSLLLVITETHSKASQTTAGYHWNTQQGFLKQLLITTETHSKASQTTSGYHWNTQQGFSNTQQGFSNNCWLPLKHTTRLLKQLLVTTETHNKASQTTAGYHWNTQQGFLTHTKYECCALCCLSLLTGQMTNK